MSSVENGGQLRMAWPSDRISFLPELSVASGYAVRTYRPGDERRFFWVMALAGFEGWDEERLRFSFNRLLPNGWFMAVNQPSGQIVATAMALHNFADRDPFWGELGWVAADPKHAGHGLGRAVSAFVVRRFLQAGYRLIHLHTDDFRLPALKSYLALGFVPLLGHPLHRDRWRTVMERLNWPIKTDTWIRGKR